MYDLIWAVRTFQKVVAYSSTSRHRGVYRSRGNEVGILFQNDIAFSGTSPSGGWVSDTVEIWPVHFNLKKSGSCRIAWNWNLKWVRQFKLSINQSSNVIVINFIGLYRPTTRSIKVLTPWRSIAGTKHFSVEMTKFSCNRYFKNSEFITKTSFSVVGLYTRCSNVIAMTCHEHSSAKVIRRSFISTGVWFSTYNFQFASIRRFTTLHCCGSIPLTWRR